MRRGLGLVGVLAACNLTWNNPTRLPVDAGARVDALTDEPQPLTDAAVDGRPDAAIPGDSGVVGMMETTLTVTPTRVRANGIARATLTLSLRDGAGGPAANNAVTVVPDGPMTITPASGTTEANGVFTAHLTSTTVGVRGVMIMAPPSTLLIRTVTFTDACDAPRLPGPPGVELTAPRAGDFNGDGRLDLIGTMTYGFGYASGNGDGTFNPPELTRISGGYYPVDVTGDFNGDAQLDAVVIGNGNVGYQVSVLLGRGDGTFRMLTPIQTNGWGQSGTSADLDGDGKLDIAFAGGSNQGWTITVLFGNGNGTFSAPQYITNASSATGVTLSAIDVDADGDADLVTGDYYSSALKLNRSNGAARTFAAAQNVATGGTGVGGLATGDLDGDSAVDVVVSGYVSSGVTVILDAFTASPQPTGLGMGKVRDSVLVVDINADGKRDLVAADATTLYVALGTGTGAFATPTQLAAPPLATLVAGDVTGDGKVDVVGTTGSLTIAMPGNGLGSFALPNLGIGGSHAVAPADLTGDSAPDLAVVPLDPWGTNQLIQVWRNLGGGTFAAPIAYTVGPKPDSIVAADLDGDGDVDLAVSTDSDVATLVNNGSGTFTVAHVLAKGGSSWSRGLVAADVNGDGKRDLAVTVQAWGASTSSLKVALNNGSGGFPSVMSSPAPGYVWWLYAAELDADGKTDIVASGQIVPTWFKGGGNGSFGSAQTIYSGDGGQTLGGLAIADMDKDGKLDVVSASIDVLIHRGNGDGTFAGPQTIAPWTAGNPVAAVDVDGNGHPDVVANGNNLSVILGRGNGSYDRPWLYPTALTDSYHTTYAIDMNGDGRLDLVGPGGMLLQTGCTP